MRLNVGVQHTHLTRIHDAYQTERRKKEAVGRSPVETAEEGSAKYKLKRLSDGPQNFTTHGTAFRKREVYTDRSGVHFVDRAFLTCGVANWCVILL